MNELLESVAKKYKSLNPHENNDKEISILAEGKNSKSYLITIGSQNYLLREYLAINDEEKIKAILNIQLFCHSNGVLVPEPMKNNLGEFFSKIDGKTYALFSYLNGEHSSGSIDQMYSLGKALAQLHLRLASCKLPVPEQDEKSYELLTEKELNTAKGLLSKEDYLLLQQEVSSIALKIELLNTLPKQLIHRDLHIKNTLFQNDDFSGFLDFDFVYYAERARDVAFCSFRHALIGAEECADHHLIIERINILLEGYNAISNLTKDEEEAIPFLIKHESLRRISYILRKSIEKNDNIWFDEISKHMRHIIIVNKMFFY